MWPYTDAENSWLASPRPALAAAAAVTPALRGAAGDMGSAAARIGTFLELLRDNPDLPADARARVLQSVIAESDRLERTVARLIEDLEPGAPAAADHPGAPTGRGGNGGTTP